MRNITIPQWVLKRAVNGPIEGAWLEFPVQVSWPELRLTEEQILANAVAWVSGAPLPYDDNSIFSVILPYYEKNITP